jgi:hypothetical membrane protein
MVAFVTAFLVIASTQLVALISEVMANVVLLLLLGVCFLLLVGVFFGDKQFTLDDYPNWVKFFMVLMFVGIVAIFLNALDWLKYVFAIFVYWDQDWAAGIIFVLVIAGFIALIVKKPKEEKKGGGK